MKILALVSSYRKKGNTARIVAMIAEHLHSQAASDGELVEIENLHLAHLQLQPCRGCRVCFDQGEMRCPLKDDLLAIKDRLLEADGLILASPVYVEDINGVMKTWIDRMAYVCHRPAFAGKYAYALTTSGVGSTSHALRTMNVALRMWGYYVIGQSGFTTGANMPREEMHSHYIVKTRKIAQEIYQSMRQGKAFKPPFLSLMTFKIQQNYWHKMAAGSIDYDYWFAKGWTDSRREYYIPHNAGHLKALTARLAGGILSRFVIGG